MPSPSAGPEPFLFFAGVNVILLREFNWVVFDPYMDEEFHVGQAQAYCRGEWDTWDPKLTTPPGLYLISVLLKHLFLFKCNLQMLRLTPLLTLLILPIILARLVCYHQLLRPPKSFFTPQIEAVVISAFPVVWFFGFLYYTDVPSLVFVLATVVAASQGKHSLAGLLGLLSCTFRQTNVIWVLYAFAYSQITRLGGLREEEDKDKHLPRLHDVLGLEATPKDIVRSIISFPQVIPQIWKAAVPYAAVVAAFVGFVIWNGGIVLGDKSNHIPSFHVPQLYYFVGFATAFGWPALVGNPKEFGFFLRELHYRIMGTKRRLLVNASLCVLMGVSIYLFTMQHPFLLSDNRHYTFYVWRRIFLAHPLVPYLLIPFYLIAGWAWFLRIGTHKTLLQTILLPLCAIPTLLLTPLLEPRYFLIPYILLRAQVVDVPFSMVIAEGVWYSLINAGTMYVFLYMEREGVGRFMW